MKKITITYTTPGEVRVEIDAPAGANIDTQHIPDAPDNAETIKSWGAPGSKVKDRVTKRAEAKADEATALFKAVARQVRELIAAGRYVDSDLDEYLAREAKKRGLKHWRDILK